MSILISSSERTIWHARFVPLAPKPISDGLALRLVCSGQNGTDPRRAGWLGFAIARVTRRSVNDPQHFRQISAIIEGLLDRGVIVRSRIEHRPGKYGPWTFTEPAPPPPPRPDPIIADPQPGISSELESPAVAVLPTDDVTLPGPTIRSLARDAPSALVLFTLLKLDFGNQARFHVDALMLAERYAMATPRFRLAISVLVSRELLVASSRDGDDGGTYRWPLPRQSKRKLDQEVSYVDSLTQYLLNHIREHYEGRKFLLPPRRTAHLLRTGYARASYTITDLAMAGHIVAVSRNVRGNVVWELCQGEPVPCDDPPREMITGRVGTTVAEKAEVVAQALRAEFGDGEFTMPISIWARRLRTQSETISAAQRFLLDNDILEMIEPLRHLGVKGKRAARFRFCERAFS